MYTTRDFKNDLYQICQNYYVRFNLLQDYGYHRISKDQFVEELEDRKDEDEINEILNEFEIIFERINLNDGQLAPDPVDEAMKLKRSQKPQEALNMILPYLKRKKDDEKAIITFGWIMYDLLKLSEKNIGQYVMNLKTFNDYAEITFNNHPFNAVRPDTPMTTLGRSILWSIRRVVTQGELFANKVLPECLRFLGNKATFIENRDMSRNDDTSAARILIKECTKSLNDSNYLLLMDTIGFDWFDKKDLQSTSFTNANGDKIELRPLAEVTLNSHAKKLLAMDLSISTEHRLNLFLDKLNTHIQKNPSYEWLPYYKAKLLMKVNRNDEAFKTITSFARTRRQEFWIWDLISEIVQEDEKFNCLCAGLLCNSKREMIVGLQEKIIPLLVERKMFANAKFELDALIATRMKNWGNVPPKLAQWKNETWYKETESVKTRDALKDSADKAEEILYRTLPFTPIFITYINTEKGVVHFSYLEKIRPLIIKEGFFYIHGILKTHHWIADEALNVRMVADKSRGNLYRVYKIEQGSEKFRSYFIQTGIGYVDKKHHNPFAFVDDIFISPNLIEEHGLKNGDKVNYIKKHSFHRNSNQWKWNVKKITSIEKVETMEN